MAQVTSRLAFRGVTLVGFVIFCMNCDVMEDDRVIHGNTIRGISFSFYLPLIDYLPCVICINYPYYKKYVNPL